MKQLRSSVKDNYSVGKEFHSLALHARHEPPEIREGGEFRSGIFLGAGLF